MNHVLFLTHYFPPEVNAPANRTFEHAIRWVRDGVNVTVITNHPNHPNGKLFPGYKNRWITRENIHGISVIRVKTYLTPNAGKIRRSLNYFVYMCLAIIAACKVRSYDVIVATSPQFFCGIAGAIAKRINKKTFVLEIRDLWPDSITAVNAVRKRGLVKRLISAEKWMYFSADRIVTLTDSFKQHITGYGYPIGRIKTITNGIDFLRVRIIQPEVCQFRKNNRFVVSYIGTLGLAHRLQTVLEAAQLLDTYDDIHFLIIGDGADRANLENEIKRNSINHATLLPLQPKKYIPYYLDLSDVGIITLRNNKLFRTVIPSKLFEYMGFAKPVIVSIPDGESTKLVEKYNCGINIQAENPAELVKAILRLYNARHECTTFGENGRNCVHKYFNRELLSRQMLDFIFMKKDDLFS
jgi:glycosyltransferase involved in cell wall biosynthesis